MATTKKSTTKAKTKTSSKRTRTSSSRKKTSLSKTAASSASSKTATNKLLTTKMLRRMQIVSAAVYLALIVPVVLYMQQMLFTVTMPYMTEDPLSANRTLTPAVRQLYIFDLRWLVVGLLAVSAVFSLLYATRLKDFYNRNIQKKQLWSRWLELAIVSGLMLEGLALLSGWQTILELKFVWLVAIVLAYLGYKQEKFASENGSQKSEYGIGAVLLILGLVLLFAATALTTFVWGITNNPWYVYALYGGLIVFFVLFSRHFKKAVTAPALVVEPKLRCFIGYFSGWLCRAAYSWTPQVV